MDGAAPSWMGTAHCIPPDHPLLNPVMPLLSLGDAGSTPRASPGHPPWLPKAYPLQHLLKPVNGVVQGAGNPSPPPPKPELGWGFRLPPEVLPGCGPAGILCTPTRTLQADPKQLKAAWAAGSFDPQGVAPTAVEPPTPPGRPPHESSVGPCGGRASASPGRPAPLYKRDEPT